MLYEKLFSKFEKLRWNSENDIPWDDIQPELLTPLQKEKLAYICRTELGALFATEAFLRDFYHDIDFSCFVSIWYYEEMKHCLIFKRYLSALGIETPTEDFQHLRMTIPPSEPETILMIHFISEHRLAMWYHAIANWIEEPVGKKIFNLVANDELRHAQSYFEYIRRDILKDPASLLKYARTAAFMLSARAPADIHAVTITGTTELLEDPDYILYIDEHVVTDEERQKTTRRIYSLLSLLFDQNINEYKDLLALVKSEKKQLANVPLGSA